MNPLWISLIVLVALFALFGIAELWFRWSFRRDARALMMLHESMRRRKR